MNHHSPDLKTLLHSLVPTACVSMLIALCIGNEAAYSATGGDIAPRTIAAARAMSPESPPDAKYRHKHYTKDELNSAKGSFTAHFKVAVGGKNENLTDPVIRIPWSSIDAVQQAIGTTEKPVRGIWIGYGLDGTRFHPIIKFMYPVPGGNLDTIPGHRYSFDAGTQKLVAEGDPKKYTDAYFKDIRVGRTDTVFTTLRSTGDADPLATWFPYADNVNRLLKENPNAHQVLVLSCISEQLAYRELMSLTGSPEEFRHLITLHIGDGAMDDLTNTTDMAKPYARTALDLGNMCPPNCPKP